MALFLDRRIGFLDIPELIERCMDAHKVLQAPSVEEILQTEAEVYEAIDGMCSRDRIS